MGFFSTNDLRSQIPTFLGVRSTNPLPAASGLVKLTSYEVAFLVVTRNSASDVNCSAPEYHSHSQVDTGKYDHFFIVIGTVQITILYFS